MAWAQSGPPLEWSPIVEVRARVVGESGTAEGLTLGQRARLGIAVERGWLTATVSFQEVRAWTRRDEAVEGGFVPGVAEGWAKLDASLSDDVGVVVTVGRQPVIVHEGRLVGARPWEMEGQFLDALRVEARALPFQLEYVNARRFDAVGEDPLGFGVNVVRLGAGRRVPFSSWTLDLLSVVDARQTSETTTTFGAYARADVRRLRSRVEGYVQGNPQGAATLFSGRAGGVIGPDERYLVSGELTLLSGGDANGLAPFRPLLGDTHTFLGLYDAFGDGAADGLVDIALQGTLRRWRALELRGQLHQFSSATTRDWRGVEGDVVARWWFSPFGALEGGYAHYFGPDQRTHWGYLDLDVAF
jgi:hypothetical protein